MSEISEETPPEPKARPNIDAIIEMLAAGGPLEEAAKKKSEAGGSEGRLFQKIEKDLNGNRAAVSDIRKMMKMSADKRADYLRTLEPLMVHYGYTLDDIDPDLVSMAGGGGAGAGTDGDDHDDEKSPDVTDNKPKGALESARAHLNGGARSPADESNEFVKSARGKPKLGIVTGSETQQ